MSAPALRTKDGDRLRAQVCSAKQSQLNSTYMVHAPQITAPLHKKDTLGLSESLDVNFATE